MAHTPTTTGPFARAQGAADRGRGHPGARRSARRELRPRRAAALRLPGPSHRHRHGQVGHHLPQDRRDAGQHRHLRILPASRRSDARRPRRHPAAAMCCWPSRTAARRRKCCGCSKPSAASARASSPSPATRPRRWRRRPTSRSTARCPRKPVRSTSCRPPARPRRSRMGDALCMTLLVEKGFREEDFAKIHPGGKLGKKLMRVDQLMHSGADAPVVRTDTPMRDVIYEMSSKALGMTCVVNDEHTAGRHHHRRRPPPLHGRQHPPARDDRRRRDDPPPDRDRSLDARRAGAAHHGAAEDHLARRRRAMPRPSRASSTCTTSGGQSCFERLLSVPRRAHRAPRRPGGREGVGALQAARRAG